MTPPFTSHSRACRSGDSPRDSSAETSFFDARITAHSEENLHKFHVFVHHSGLDGRPAVSVLHVGVGLVCQKEDHGGLVALRGGQAERSLLVEARLVQIHVAGLEQLLHFLHLSFARSVHELPLVRVGLHPKRVADREQDPIRH